MATKLSLPPDVYGRYCSSMVIMSIRLPGRLAVGLRSRAVGVVNMVNARAPYALMGCLEHVASAKEHVILVSS